MKLYSFLLFLLFMNILITPSKSGRTLQELLDQGSDSSPDHIEEEIVEENRDRHLRSQPEIIDKEMEEESSSPIQLEEQGRHQK
uniref:Uncharacterized protein n=1 Tax=Meloidogyne enterolobii TaxID=390850 RepID=A0A6V7TXH1_MELEN|nr:unnamed protein product [Meloidogyne enterolobii]